MFATMARWITPSEPINVQLQAQPSSTIDESPRELPLLAGIDIQAGLANVVGNQKLYERLLRRFADEQRDFAHRQRGLLESGDSEQATRLAHTLKGVAGSLGARGLETVAGELEAACRNGQELAQCMQVLERVEAALVPSLAAIEQWPVDRESAPRPESAVVDFEPLLDRLQGLLESYDAEANDVTEELQQMMAGSAQETNFRRLRKLVDDFDFDAALEIVSAIRADTRHKTERP